MNSTIRNIVLGVAFSLTLVGCAAPKFLWNSEPMGERLVHYYVISGSEEGFFDFHMRVCNLAADGELSNCADTLVLENVARGTLD